MTRYRTALLIVLLLVTGIGIAAAAAGEKDKTPEALATEGIRRLMQAMELLLQTIPQYEMPVMNENGDIIIRRKRTPQEGGPDEPARPEKRGKAI